MDSKKYASCNVAGDGKLYAKGNNNVDEFKIIDMSATAIRLETSAVLQVDMGVKLQIRLIGGPIDAHIDINGKVKRPLEKGYEIVFVDMSDYDREEIDELMRNSCNIED